MFEGEVNPDRIEKADLVVSIPSYNEADSIAYPVQQASLGIKKYFPDKRAVIINCDTLLSKINLNFKLSPVKTGV